MLTLFLFVYIDCVVWVITIDIINIYKLYKTGENILVTS